TFYRIARPLGGARRGANEADVTGAQVLDGLGRRLGGHAHGEAEQDPGGEAGPGRVRGGGVHTVVRRDAHHVDLVHVVRAQPVGQRRPGLVGALEPAVGGRMLALQEHRLHGPGVQVRVEVRAGRPGYAVRRPGGRVVRMVREVRARVDVEVLGRHHVPVAGFARHVLADRARHRGAAGHGELAALAEVVLDINDDECAHEPTVSSGPGKRDAGGVMARAGYWNHNVHYQPVILRAVPP